MYLIGPQIDNLLKHMATHVQAIIVRLFGSTAD